MYSLNNNKFTQIAKSGAVKPMQKTCKYVRFQQATAMSWALLPRRAHKLCFVLRGASICRTIEL